MKAMILAAGKGTRMLPLTATTPKPLIKVYGKALIEHHIIALQKAGVTEIIINLHHLGPKVEQYLGNGDKYKLKITYVKERELLETGGGVLNALPYLGNKPFILVSADIYTDFDFSKLLTKDIKLGHLVLLTNPVFNINGDFSLSDSQEVMLPNNNTFTYANIALLSPDLFKDMDKHNLTNKFPLVDILHLAIAKKQITGEIFSGMWHNVGTPEQLSKLTGSHI